MVIFLILKVFFTICKRGFIIKHEFMYKYLSICILLWIVSFQVYAKQVDHKRAQNIAAEFLKLQENAGFKSISISDLIPVELSLPGENRFFRQKSKTDIEDQLVYFFKKKEGGFVLVSGDDLAKPILAYSVEGPVNENNLPVNFLKWVEGYKQEIRWIRQQPGLKSTSATSEWEQLETGMKQEQLSGTAVGPLMKTKWDQSPLYNDLCPQKNWYSNKAVTGCVATAMAQVIKYHNYPVNGTGIHSYYHSNNTVTYGTLSANYGATTYDWANMPNQLSSASTATQIKAVATLMLHCGIGVDMDYSPYSSGAQILESKSAGSSCAEYALKEFFNFDKTTVKGILREGKTTNQWISLLKSEIDAGRPILHGGVGDGGGHAFVADGYDNNNYFHFNWGWSGNSDGYYSVDALNPVDLGTGAGNGSYNRLQQVVIGIKPPTQGSGTSTTKSEDIRLYASLSLPKIYQLNEFEFEVTIANYGTGNFNGNFCAALFNSEGKFVNFIDSLDAYVNLPSNFYNTYKFTNKGLSVYPGKYIVGIYFRPTTNNWVAVGDGTYENFVNLEILSPFGDTDIKLYDSIRVSPYPLIAGKSAEVTTKIANYGTTDYKGQFGAGLFKLNGDIVQTIEIIDVSLSKQWWQLFTFKDDKIEAEPGTYYIGMVHFPNSGDNQVVIAPGSFLNPVEVNVTLPPILPDDLENNNTVSSASVIKLEFKQDVHWYYYTGLNIDNQNDEDYFRFKLPTGYQYKIWARVHDVYDNEIEDEEYSCDVIFAHSDNGEWSEVFDTEMDYTYTLNNGGDIYFGVIPYYEGETGTYSIEFKIERTLGSEVTQIALPQKAKIYFSPASSNLHIETTEPMLQVELQDQLGRLILQQSGLNVKKTHIETAGFARGIYQVRIKYPNRVQTDKIMIHE